MYRSQLHASTPTHSRKLTSKPIRGFEPISTHPHPAQPEPWPKPVWAAILLALALYVIAIHGYHPLAEDGGLYIAGVEYKLDPALFPRYTDFVREHLRFSVFAPAIATTVRLTHLSLLTVLLFVDILTTWLTLFSACQILRRTFPNRDAAQLAGIALLAAWWTMPVAGTSLLLMDPYITARSFSTPLSLLAIAIMLDDALTLRSYILTALCLGAAALFHPLMASYALAFVIVLQTSKRRRPILGYIALTLCAIVIAATLQATASAEPPALQAAVITRYYWFLSQWHWYELLGLAGPPTMLALLLIFRRHSLSRSAIHLCNASIAIAAMAVLMALLFAHESSSAHIVARLQILRIYLMLYAVMAMLLGGTLFQLCDTSRSTLVRATPTIALAAMAAIMGVVQHLSFPNSDHVELPWRANLSPNPWVQAFFWARQNTPSNALFALDARYVNTDGEDAQTFRATALRSALPDYSKDGGEASITPALAPQWQAASQAQRNLDKQPDSQRDANLKPFGVTWIILRSASITTHRCPYDNQSIKVCQLYP